MKSLGNFSFALLLAGMLFHPEPGLAESNLEVARQLNQAFVEVAEKVMPSVVILTVHQRPPDFSSLDGESNPSRRQFQRRFRGDPEETIGSGSGVIIRKDGYLVTNRHVVEAAERIEVRLKDGRKFTATVRGVDPQSDVAVLKIDATNLPCAQLADSAKTRVGEFAIAIGTPFQFDYSVTFGHVSAKSRDNVIPRYLGGGVYDQDYLQTDANINPGNSGGPLVNLEGEVIGINTIIQGMNTGIGFAIPSSLVREVADQLIAEGKFTRAWLGVSIVALAEEDEYRELFPEVKAGVVVRAIMPDGPAAQSNLRPSDVILAVDGRAVTTPQELRNEIRGKKLGAPLQLTVSRAGQQKQIEIRPSAQSPELSPQLAVNRTRTNAPVKLGLEVKALTAELAEKFSVKTTDAGVLVISVEADGLAQQNGIQPGDIITAINQLPTPSPRRFRETLRAADLKKGVVVNVTSGGTARFEILKSE